MPRILFPGLLLVALSAPALTIETEECAAAVQRTPFLQVEELSPDARYLATGAAWIENPGELWIKELATGTKRHICKNHSDAINALAFSSGGAMLASGDWRGMVKVWNSATGKELASFKAHDRQVWSLAFSPGGTMLASSSPTGIKLWEMATGKRRASIAIAGEENGRLGPHAGYCLAFSPDGRTLAYGADDGVTRLWDVATARERARLVGDSGPLLGLAFSPDGQTLATASRDGTVKLWNVASGHLKSTLAHKDSLRSVAFSPDGRMLASCYWSEKYTKNGPDNDRYGTQIKVWEIATCKERVTFCLENVDFYVRPLPMQFTSEQGLMTICHDGTVKTWDLRKMADNLKQQ